MATNYVTLKGSLKWAKVYEPDEFSGQKRWMVSFYPFDDKEWEKFNKMGSSLEPKEDDDGKFVVFRRPTTKLIRDDLVVFSPPEITGAVNVKYVDEEGNTVRSYKKGDKVVVSRVGDPTPLGNGTVALVNLAFYDVKIGGEPGKGHRLENIKVLDLVGYDEDAPAPERKVEEKKEEPAKDLKKDLDDEIPW